MENKKLAEYALIYNACKPALKKILESKSEVELIELYKKNIDFCLNENFPDLEYLKTVDQDVLGKEGIFYKGDVISRNAGFLVLLGTSIAEVDVDGYEVSQIFVKHKAVATIDITGNAYVVIDCFDDSCTEVVASGGSKVLINVYGNPQVDYSQSDNARVKVVNKGKDKY